MDLSHSLPSVFALLLEVFHLEKDTLAISFDENLENLEQILLSTQQDKPETQFKEK